MRTQRASCLPSRRIGLDPALYIASSTASTIAETWRSLDPEAMRNTSVRTSCSLTSSAMISSALRSDAARAAMTASSRARSVAVTCLRSWCGRSAAGVEGAGVVPRPHGGGRGARVLHGQARVVAGHERPDEQAEDERDGDEDQVVQPRVRRAPPLV